jgi:hypothetical protein
VEGSGTEIVAAYASPRLSFLPPGDSMERHQGGRLIPEPLGMICIGSELTSPLRAPCALANL